MIGPAFTGSVTSPSFTVVSPLKLERIHPVEFKIPKKSFICLKASNYNKSVALPGYPMHIKTVNTEGEHRCIIVGHNDIIRVDMRKGYGAIHWLGFFMVAFYMDSIYPRLNYDTSQELLLLALRLILVFKRAGYYIIYGGSRF